MVQRFDPSNTGGITAVPDTAGAETGVPTSIVDMSGAPFQDGSAGAALQSRSAAMGMEQPQGNGRETLHRWAVKAHQAIDRMEQTLGRMGNASAGESRLPSRLSGEGGLREQASRYSGQIRNRLREQPLQTAGIVFAAGVVLSKLLLGGKRTRVEVVKVPMYLPERHAGASERMHRPLRAADDTLQRAGDSGRIGLKKLGATTMLGAANARAMGSRLWHETRNAIPSGRQLRHKTDAYRGMALDRMQEHPLVGVALALGIGAVAVTLAMRREDDPFRW